MKAKKLHCVLYSVVALRECQDRTQQSLVGIESPLRLCEIFLAEYVINPGTSGDCALRNGDGDRLHWGSYIARRVNSFDAGFVEVIGFDKTRIAQAKHNAIKANAVLRRMKQRGIRDTKNTRSPACR